MLNIFSVAAITGVLILLYLWRITKIQGKFVKELISLLVISLVLVFWFYSHGILRVIGDGNSGVVQGQTDASTRVSKPTLNSFETMAQEMVDQPFDSLVAESGAPRVSILYPLDGDVFPASTDSIVVKAQVVDDDPSPVVAGVGKFTLQTGLNPITVVVVDSDGNASSAYVVVQKLAN